MPRRSPRRPRGPGRPETQRQRKVWLRYWARSPLACVTGASADTQTRRSTATTTDAPRAPPRSAVTSGSSPGSVYDPRDRRPLTVVGASDEEHLLARAMVSLRRTTAVTPRHPEQLPAHHGAKVRDVGRIGMG